MEAILNIISTSSKKIFDIPVEDGNLIFLNDHSSIALDIGGVRTLYSNIQTIHSSLKASIAIPAFYYLIDLNELWRFDGSQWIAIAGGSGEITSYDSLIDVPIKNLSGSVGNPIVISELEPGTYNVVGGYKMSPSESTMITSTPLMFYVRSDIIQGVLGNSIVRYDIKNNTQEIYITDGDIVKSLAKESDIDHLFS